MTDEAVKAVEEKLKEAAKKEEVVAEEKKPKSEDEIWYTFTIGWADLNWIIKALSEAPAKHSYKHMSWLADMKMKAYQQYLEAFEKWETE